MALVKGRLCHTACPHWAHSAPKLLRYPATAPKGRLRQAAAKDAIDWPRPQEQPPFWERPPRQLQQEPTSRVQQDEHKLQVVHVTAEMAPIAKVGGLGDVVTGLGRACLQRGHAVSVILPFYECLPEAGIQDLTRQMDFNCPKGSIWDGRLQVGSLPVTAFTGRIEGIPVVLLRPDWGQSSIFRGAKIYGGNCSELEAYLFLSRASLEYLKVSGAKPDIIHTHEWQLSAVPMLYWEAYASQGLPGARLVLTIHCLDNSGECREDEFAFTGMPGKTFAQSDKALDDRTIGHNPERLSLLKGGIVYSNAVTTVSPTYAHEAVHGGAAGYLNSTLAGPRVRPKFHGILNGIDAGLWDPERDPWIPASFSAADLAGKQLCKRYLQKGLGLVTEDKPIVACVTRLVPQKGIHLIRHSIFRTQELGGQVLLLGTGHLDTDFQRLAESDFRGHPDIRLMLMYSEALSHLIYAAADIVLVPSMFEPCGLTQLVAMRYGALPVVRRTGGLADTVHDLDSDPERGNGFVFDGVDEGSLNSALDRALSLYRDDPKRWQQVAQRNMQEDNSWEKSAGEYVQLYGSILNS